jgi:hypothetical protein
MEQRTKVGVSVLILMILLGVIIGWYRDLHKIDYKTVTEKRYLTTNQKIAMYGPVSVETYEIYQVNDVSYKVTRSTIPLRWNYEELKKSGFGKFMIER